MLNFQRHLFANSICWLITISAFNLSSVIWRLSTTGEQTYNFNLLTFLGGFLLEIPLIALLSVITAVLMWSTHRAPAAIRTLTHGLFHLPVVLVIIFFYFTSEFLHQQIGFYISIDAFSIIFTDSKQLFFNAWHDASVQIMFTLAAAGSITFLWIPATARLHTLAKKRSKITKSFLLLASAAFAITLSTYPFMLKHNLAPQIKYNSFPTTYAITTWLESKPYTSTIKETSPLSTLTPIISLEQYSDQAGKPNSYPPVFLIMLEAISSDHVGFNGYHRSDITPHLDTLAKDSLIFPNAYATSNHSNYAQTSISSSQYPRRRNHLDMFQTIDYPKTLLFDVLGHYGYETALFSSQNENWQGMRRFLLTNSKIDTFFHSPDALGENIKIETKLDDAFTRQKAQEFIASRTSAKPLFLALNFQRTHFPYSLNSKEPGPYQPTDIQGKFAFFNYSPKEAPNVINKFDNALRYVDSQVGIFIQFLKKQGLYDDAIILVMPDHGEAFYQNGFPTHGTTLYDAQVKTFLLIKTPQSKLRGEKTETISLIDINPSVLALLGLPNHPNFQGVDIIFEKYENRPIFMTAQGIIPADGVVVYPWKFIRCLKMGEKLINAKIDPSEMVDFSSQFPEIRKTLENMLNSYIHTQMTYYNCLSNKYYQPKF